MQKKDRDCGDNAQRDEDEERDPHANRNTVHKRVTTGWDSHESREPFVEFHGFQSLGRCLTEGIEVRPELYCQVINLWRFVLNVERDGLQFGPGRDLAGFTVYKPLRRMLRSSFFLLPFG